MAKAVTELTYAGSNDVNEVAWYSSNSGRKTHPTGQKKPNVWGVYDCSGNVWEWCSDEWNDTAYQGRISSTRDPHEWVGSAAVRVLRGGGWLDGAGRCRVAFRYGLGADYRGSNLGLRLLRSREP